MIVVKLMIDSLCDEEEKNWKKIAKNLIEIFCDERKKIIKKIGCHLFCDNNLLLKNLNSYCDKLKNSNCDRT